MRWNMAAECISVVFLAIIWIYSRKGRLLPSLKNKLFYTCFLTTFCAMVFNILSTLMLLFPQVVPKILTWFVTEIYFVATPIMGMTYFFYTVAVLYEKKGNAARIIALGSIPGICYVIMVLINPFTKALFDIMPDGTYVQGHLIAFTYFVFYLYCMAALLLALLNFRYVEKSIGKILTVFPLVAFGAVLVQQFIPTVVLSGSAATSVLLIIYLYLQNKQNSIDFLTGLANRKEFLNNLELRLKKYEKSSFCIIVLSLRGFKQINDTFGQNNGDILLKNISEYLESICSPQGLFRYSGDEFAILENDKQSDTVNTIICKIQERLKSPWHVNEFSCMVQGSIGIVHYPNSAADVQGLINGIEYAVSRAKTGNSNSPYYCGQEMLDELRRRNQILSILKNKISNNSLDVFYQPIMSTVTKRFELAESLLRIQDSPIGPIYPSEFIPIAEDAGLIVEMTYQVLDKVCKFINRLEKEGIHLDGVHINFSTLQFNQIDLVKKITDIIDSNQTTYSKIKIEITESVLAENMKQVAEFAEEMHKRGIMLGLDDFGTGYSNIVSVMDTSFDTVKIDKSLVWSAMTNQKSAVMAKNITRIFHEMDLKVVAEGVETMEQNDFIEACKVELIQGFYYAKPMSEEDALRVLRNAQGIHAV